jgi:YhcH/YjgK/YiaL family protein
MIFDTINNSSQYTKLHDNFKKAFNFINQYEKKPLSDGVHKIDGENLFAIVDSYYTNEVETQKAEAHRKYIDIQYIYSGKEKIGYCNIGNMKPVKKYSNQNDITFFEYDFNNWLFIKEKEFVIFYPEDVHMPCIRSGTAKSKVKKIVIKILV